MPEFQRVGFNPDFVDYKTGLALQIATHAEVVSEVRTNTVLLLEHTSVYTAVAETEVQVEQAKSQFEINKMQQKAEIDRQLLELRYQFDIKLKQMETQQIDAKEKMIEDRKDERTRIQATQQSKMIDQRKNDLLPTDFEQNQQNPLLG